MFSEVRHLLRKENEATASHGSSFGAQDCVNIEMAVLGSPSLMVLTVSVDVKEL